MLGLGDIVLPGLLLSFAARLDAARLVCTLYSATKKSDEGIDQQNENINEDNRRNIRNRAISPAGGSPAVDNEDSLLPPMSAWYALLFGGYGYYFLPLMIAYAVGLFMANAAVYLMQMGQPALLYLVPCTLGTMAYKGWKQNELLSLWNGPKILKQADYVCYGHPSSSPTATAREVVAENTPVSGVSDRDEAMIEQEFVDDEVGDQPLLSSTGGPSNKNSE